MPVCRVGGREFNHRQDYKRGYSKTVKIMLTVTQVFVAVLLLVGDVTFKPLLVLFPLSFLSIGRGQVDPSVVVHLFMGCLEITVSGPR